MELSIKSKTGYEIPCIAEIPSETDLIVIAIHGFGGNKSSGAIRRLSKKLEEANKGFFAFDLITHGESKAPKDAFLLSNVLYDMDSVFSYLEENYKKADIGVFATSFGAYSFLIYQTKNKERLIAKALLRSSAIDMEKILLDGILKDKGEDFSKNGFVDCKEQGNIRVRKEYFEELKENRLFEKFEKNELCEYLMIHGTSDELAPISDARSFSEKFDINLIEIKGADHRFKRAYDLEQMINYSINFFLQ